MLAYPEVEFFGETHGAEHPRRVFDEAQVVKDPYGLLFEVLLRAEEVYELAKPVRVKGQRERVYYEVPPVQVKLQRRLLDGRQGSGPFIVFKPGGRDIQLEAAGEGNDGRLEPVVDLDFGRLPSGEVFGKDYPVAAFDDYVYVEVLAPQYQVAHEPAHGVGRESVRGRDLSGFFQEGECPFRELLLHEAGKEPDFFSAPSGGKAHLFLQEFHEVCPRDDAHDPVLFEHRQEPLAVAHDT